MLSWSHHFERFMIAITTWLIRMECFVTDLDNHLYIPFVVVKSRPFLVRNLTPIIAYRQIFNTSKMRVPLVEKKLLILTWFLDSFTVFTGVIVMLLDVDFCLSFRLFGSHCIVCPSSIHGFWSSVWHLFCLVIHIPPLKKVIIFMKAFKNSSMGFKVFELKFVTTNLGVYVCACMNINTFLVIYKVIQSITNIQSSLSCY